LLTIVTILALFAVRSLAALATRASWTIRRRSRIGRRRYGGLAFRRSCGCAFSRSDLCRLLTMLTTWTVRTSLGAARRAPHFDEGGFFGGLRFYWCAFDWWRRGFGRRRFSCRLFSRFLHRRRNFSWDKFRLG
jgi:hypothetical protein